MNIAYVRVSSVEQNESRQIESLTGSNIEKWFKEKVSGKDQNRPMLREMLDFVREGDTVFIHDFSRLARSTRDLLDIVDHLQKKGVCLVSHKENIDTGTPTGKLMLTMIGAINEFERLNMLERQREGINIAKKNGVYKGRKKIVVPEFNGYYEEYKSRKVSKAALAERLGFSRPTLDRIILEYEKEHS